MNLPSRRLVSLMRNEISFSLDTLESFHALDLPNESRERLFYATGFSFAFRDKHNFHTLVACY